MRLAYPLLLLCLACGAGAPPQPLQTSVGPQNRQAEQARTPPPAEPVEPVGTPREQEGATELAPSEPKSAPALESEISLGPLDPAEKSAVDDNGFRRIGVHRELPSLPPPAAAWTADEDGKAVWRTVIRSPGAVALRIHFLDLHLGGGNVAIYEASARPAPERRYEGDGPAGDGELWSDIIEGDAAVVEYRPGSDEASGGPVPFGIDKISHLWQSPLDAF